MKGYKMQDRRCRIQVKRFKNHGSWILHHTSGPLNQKGIALVMVLILAAIALAITAGLIYMITSTTQISGMQKRYRTAFEASMGGADVMYQLIAARGNPNIPGISFYFNDGTTVPTACINAKLNKTADSASDKWGVCPDYAKATSSVIDSNDVNTYDFTFVLGSSPYPTYTAYAKIVSTIEGNSGGDEGLIGKGVVSAGSGEITVMSIPYMYTIEVATQSTSNPNERAKLSILYQY
jgi:hypothetical protein